MREFGAVAEARAQGFPIYGETLHNYACFNAENYREDNGMKYHTYPSLKSPGDADTLWQGLLDGRLSTVATDLVSTTWEEKIRFKTVADVTGGHNGIETRVGIAYTEGVVRRGMSLERFVDITSTNAAKIFGLYPQKGAIAAGSDADITIIDPSIKGPLALDDLHLEDYSIWGRLAHRRLARHHHPARHRHGRRPQSARHSVHRPFPPQKDRLRRPRKACLLTKFFSLSFRTQSSAVRNLKSLQ